MNAIDKIIAALTPGSIFNRNGHVFRSIATLVEFTNLEEQDVFEVLNGDMADLVTCKPSKKGRGVLVALTDQIPQPIQEEEDLPVQIIPGGVGPPGVDVEVQEGGAVVAPEGDVEVEGAAEPALP